MATEERERKRRITDPVLVAGDLGDVFEDRQAVEAIAVLTFMGIKNVEDVYINYPGLLATMQGSETQLKNLGTAMKAAGLRTMPRRLRGKVSRLTPPYPQLTSVNCDVSAAAHIGTCFQHRAGTRELSLGVGTWGSTSAHETGVPHRLGIRASASARVSSRAAGEGRAAAVLR